MSRSFDPRPRNPAQLAAVGGILLALAWFGLLGTAGRPVLYIGAVLLLLAAISWMAQPHRRTTYWRGQEIDMTGELTWWERLYYCIYRG